MSSFLFGNKMLGLSLFAIKCFDLQLQSLRWWEQ